MRGPETFRTGTALADRRQPLLVGPRRGLWSIKWTLAKLLEQLTTVDGRTRSPSDLQFKTIHGRRLAADWLVAEVRKWCDRQIDLLDGTLKYLLRLSRAG